MINASETTLGKLVLVHENAINKRLILYILPVIISGYSLLKYIQTDA